MDIHPKGQNQKPKTLPKNILEALREMGSGISSDALDQLGTRPRRIQEDRTSGEFPYPYERRPQPNLEIRREERMVFSSREQETKQKVILLQDEAKKLATAVQNLNKEVVKTSFEAPVSPGIYHENFFEKVISFIKSLRERIENASIWLSAHNSRSKRKSHYWNQVGKSGSKYMLSQERYMATQAG